MSDVLGEVLSKGIELLDEEGIPWEVIETFPAKKREEVAGGLLRIIKQEEQEDGVCRLTVCRIPDPYTYT